jgi:superfamily II DNA or RNA helicase
MTTNPVAGEKRIKLDKRGLLLRLRPVDDYVRLVLNDIAVYKRNIGQDPRTRRYKFRDESVWFQDKDDPATAHMLDGLRPRLVKALRAADYTVDFEVHPNRLPAFEPDLSWITAEDAKFRGGQIRILTKILSTERGQFKGVPALGKTYLIQRLCRCFPQPEARIVICTPGLGLVNDYYVGLLSYLGYDHRRLIGVSKGGSGLMTQKIVISTPQSLGKIPAENVYLLFFDEAHKAGAYDTVTALTRFVWARMYALSASIDGRTDGTNRAIEAIFGPIIEEVTYREAVKEGYVPDVETFFYRTRMSPMDRADPQTKELNLIIHNVARNRLVRDVCNFWNDKLKSADGDPQIIVIVDRAEHAAVLHRLLPDYRVIFENMDRRPKNRLRKLGYCEDELRGMKKPDILKAQRALSDGLLRKAIVISTMGTGVDTKHLDVVVRADGGKSPVSIAQYRGRVMRGNRGVYVDFLDTGERRFENAAMARYRDALKVGMKVKAIDFATGRELTMVSGGRDRYRPEAPASPPDGNIDGAFGGW